MTSEQKIKAYDEAFNKAIVAYKDEDRHLKATLERIFPELKESGDEIIRKTLIELVKCNERSGYTLLNNVPTSSMLAWLERQGEHTIACSEEQMKVLNEVLNFAANHESSYWNDYIFETLSNLIRQLKHKVMKKSKIGNYVVDDCGYLWNIDKVEPKFKVGNWYLCIKDFFGKGVTFDKNTTYYCAKEGCLQDEYGFHIAIVKDLYDNFKLWDISDAKDGDVLCYETKDEFRIFIYKNGHIHYHCCYCNAHLTTVDSFFVVEKYLLCYIHPATKAERELLFKTMEEEGYEWDAEKKELKKTDEEFNGEDYGIDSLFHAQRILEKTLGKVEGYQSDDGILAHKCAVTAVNKLYKQKPAWSEEDERIYQSIIDDTVQENQLDIKQIDWLKSIKRQCTTSVQNMWKPSKEQIVALRWILNNIPYNKHKEEINGLLEQIKDL